MTTTTKPAQPCDAELWVMAGKYPSIPAQQFIDVARDVLNKFGAGQDAAPVSAEPVATVGSCYQLLWVGGSPIASLVKRHNLKPGSELYAAPVAAQAQPYSLNLDPAGIRALTADAITGALALGAQGAEQPPANHWLKPFYEMGLQSTAEEKTVVPAVAQKFAERLSAGLKSLDQRHFNGVNVQLAIRDVVHSFTRIGASDSAAMAQAEQQGADKVDAERYRWLREKRTRQTLEIVLKDEGEELDTAIDAARKEPDQ